MVEYEELALDDELILYESDSPKSTLRNKITCKRVSVFCCLTLLCVVFISICITTAVVMPKVTYKYYWIFGNDDIVFTSEYQIDIEFDDSWLDREEQIAKWNERFEENCKYFHLSEAEVESSTRLQYYKKISHKETCHCSTEIRVREYISGDKTGITVDAKGNDKEEINAFYLPYQPGDKYYANSTQKCEHDRHEDPSDDKYSRETRITLASETALDTCEDIAKLFPGIAIKKKYYSNVVDEGNHEYWFVREYTGIMDKDTKYKIAFTMSYGSHSAAEAGTSVPYAGEWSIRLYTTDEGLSHSYNQKVLSEVEQAWRILALAQ